MKIGTLLLIAAAAFAGYELLQLNVAGNTVQILLNGVKINNLTNYTVQLLVQNVSNATVNLNSLVADITVNGTNIGNVSDFTAVQIGPNSQQSVNMTITPSLLNLPGAVTQIINAGTGQLNFVVTGNANVDTLVLPFSLSNTVSI